MANQRGRQLDFDENATHRAPNDKNPLFLPPSPLDHLVGALSKRVPAGVRTRDAIHFEERSYPCKRYRVVADAVVDFEMGVFGVDAGVERVV